jgi:hypothetical protein
VADKYLRDAGGGRGLRRLQQGIKAPPPAGLAPAEAGKLCYIIGAFIGVHLDESTL